MTSCHVLFSGDIVADADPQVVAASMAAELGVSQQKAKQLFSGRTVVLKSHVTDAEAEAMVVRLREIGAVCRVKMDAPKPTANPARYKSDTRSPDKTMRDLTAAHVECPRCGHMQLIAEHCARCGVDIEQAERQRRKEDLLIEKKLRELKGNPQAAPERAASPSAAPKPVRKPAPAKSSGSEAISADISERPAKIGGWFRRRRSN